MEPIVVVLILVGLLIVAVLGVVLTRRRPSDTVTVPPPKKTAAPPPTAPPPAAPPPAAPPPTAPGLAGRLARSRAALGGALRAALGRDRLDGEVWEQLEEALIAADMGVEVATEVVERVRDARPESTEEAAEALRAELVSTLSGRDRRLHLAGSPAVVLVVGVNGVGKTTSIAKLAALLRAEGIDPLLGAADTYRAAADAQLRTWAGRVGVEVVGGQEGADPAAVAFDAFAAARARGRGAVIIDTAGRLHSKQNLMAELAKIRRVLEREAGSVDETLLVLDATAGQNGIVQAQVFTEAVGVSGVILTKLDGTARGGIVVAVETQLGIPVKYIGVGEGIDDLVPFDPEAFVEALLEVRT